MKAEKAPTVEPPKLRPRKRAAVRPTVHPSPQAFRFTKHIRELTADYAFTEGDLAEVLDVTKRTISRWKTRNEIPSEQKIDRINVLESILDLGKKVLGSEGEVKKWLNRSVFSLEGQ